MSKLDERIKKAAERCKKAFNAARGATYAWCCHHEVRIERLSYTGFQDRIKYILNWKPRNERIRRLNNFRPVLTMPQAGQWHDRALARLHRKDVPNHTFKRGSIFGK